MAGTLNYFNNMRTIFVCFTIIICCVILTDYNPNSITSPVEEIYHRQLVTTIDSILDSRYPCGVIEDNSVYPSIDSLSSIAVPNNR